MMSDRRFGIPLFCSVLVHLALAFLLFYVARESVISEPAPVSVELWTSAPLAPAVALKPALPVPQPETEAPAEAEQPKADIQLGRKPMSARHEASTPSKTEPKPKPKPKPKPAPPKPLPPVKLPADKKPQPDKHALAPDKPGKGKKFAKHYSDDTNDLLADLNSSNTSRPANSRVDRAGAANGVAGGVPNGSALARDNYAAKVQSRVRPLVQLPPELKGNPKAVVQVQLLPTLEVRAVKLLQSSGSPAYDEAVQRAIWEAKTFPALPSGMGFNEVRQIRLEFRPK